MGDGAVGEGFIFLKGWTLERCTQGRENDVTGAVKGGGVLRTGVADAAD